MSRKIDPACFCSCNILIFFSFYQEAKKKYDKETEKYCGILEKHLNLSSKKKESQLQEVRNHTSIVNKLFNFTWCREYVLVTLCQKVLGLEETSETGAWMACISSHPHTPLVAVQPVRSRGTCCWSRSPSSLLGSPTYENMLLPCKLKSLFLFLSSLTLILYSIMSPLTFCLISVIWNVSIWNALVILPY